MSEHRCWASATIWFFGHLSAIQDHERSFRPRLTTADRARDPMGGNKPGATPRPALISGPCSHLIDRGRQIREENSGATVGEITPPGLGHEAHDAAEPWVRYELARATPFQ
jgi:hypothetical protein